MKKLYISRRGSCRGDAFGGDESIDITIVKKLLKDFKKSNEDSEKLETDIDEITDVWDISTVLYDSIMYDTEDFEKILKKGKGYLGFEEYSVGFGLTKKEAKLSLMDGLDEDGCW